MSGLCETCVLGVFWPGERRTNVLANVPQIAKKCISDETVTFDDVGM